MDTHIAFRAIPATKPKWVQSWQHFLAQHGSWWPRFAGQGPVYYLPKSIIKSLRRVILDGNSLQAELDLNYMCCRYSHIAIGVWDGQPIDYPLPFDLDRLKLSDKSLQELSSTKYAPEVDWRSCPIIDTKAWRAIHHQLLGYVGRLVLDDQYSSEMKSLKDRWLALGCRPSFPLVASVLEKPAELIMPKPVSSEQDLCEESIRFLKDTALFMRKWQLNRLITSTVSVKA